MDFTVKQVAKNQVFVQHGDIDLYQSYNTPIIEVDHGNAKVYINTAPITINGKTRPAYKASNTTKKYLKQFFEWTFGDDAENFFKNLDENIENRSFYGLTWTYDIEEA